MSDQWTDRLSEYIDGELAAGEAARVEEHLATCAECAATATALREVAMAAADLPDEPPARDLWPSIEARLAPRGAAGLEPRVIPLAAAARRARRSVLLTVPQLLAAGIALILFSAGGVWFALGGGPAGQSAAPPLSAERQQGAVTFVSSWEAAVAELEAEFDQQRPDLDPGTILVVERNLAIIDGAIAEARQALEADPGSGFLKSYVADAMRRKVDLLRQATRIQRTES